jgi:RNA polymerase sigma-70 factor (ECF subfamily)
MAAITADRGAGIEALIDGRVDPGYRLARAILLDDAEAEDAVQDACLTAWRQRSSLRDEASFESWFDRILVNTCRDRLRRRRRLREITDLQARDAEAANRGRLRAAAPFEGPDVDAALAALDVDHRVVVLLRFWQDRTLEDIAVRLGIPPGTVKSRLHYALRELRSRLEASHG